MMDDIREEITVEDGTKFRLDVFESSSVPLGYVRYEVYMYIPELDWWYKLERSFGMLLDRALEAGRYRLAWWSKNVDKSHFAPPADGA
jgi:hypothetical protein